MSQSISLPKDDLGAQTTIRKHSFLETSDQAAVWHETDRKIESRYRSFRDRENDLIVGSGRALAHLETILHIACQALASSINLVVDHEDGAVTAPRYMRIMNRRVYLITLFERKISIIDISLVQDVKLRRKNYKLTRPRRNSKVFLVRSPGSS